MTTREWIAGGTGALIAWLAITALTETSPGPDPDSLPPVSAGLPERHIAEASDLIDLTADETSIDLLLSGEPQVYYQYTDEGGAVRFARSLLEVPEDWRDRAGRIELAVPPPTSPAETRMLLKLRYSEGASR